MANAKKIITPNSNLSSEIAFYVRCAMRNGKTNDTITDGACREFGYGMEEFIKGVIAGASPLVAMEVD